MTTQKHKLWENSNCKCYNSKTQIVTKPKLWENLKTQVRKKLKNCNCEEKTQTVTKLQNSNFDKNLQTQIATKLKLWEKELQTHIVTKLETQKSWIATKHKNSNFDQPHKQEIVTKVKNQIMTNSNEKRTLNCLLVRTTWHLNNRWDVLWAAF